MGAFERKRIASFGFTIVELLIVVVVIAILASVVIVSYSGIQQRAAVAERESEMKTLLQAIHLARINKGQSLGQITGSYWTLGTCTSTYPTGNPSSIEPKDLPKDHACWQRYYDFLTAVGTAAQMNLDGLRSGDYRGNPYAIDESEGEGGDFCLVDGPIRYFTGDGVATANGPAIPKYYPSC